MRFLRGFRVSFREKPIVYLIFLLTVVLSVVVSYIFYNLTKNQIIGTDFSTTTYFGGNSDMESDVLYDRLSETNIEKISDKLTKEHIFEENGTTSHDSIIVEKIYFEDSDLFDKAELESGRAVAIVSTAYSQAFGVNVGDKLSFGGVEFEIIRKVPDSQNVFYLPASVSTGKEAGFEERFPSFIVKSNGKLSVGTLDLLKETGLIFGQEKGFDSSALIGIILGIAVMAIAAVNTLTAYAYIIKRNGRQYAVYKTIGAKNRDIAAMMCFETVVILIAAFAVGATIGYFVTKPVEGEFFVKLNAVDYIILFAINLAAVFIALGIKMRKTARTLPAECMRREGN